MNELIKVTTNDKQQPVVSGRELHQLLGVGTEYAKWFERMTEYGFSIGTDFSSVLTESTGGRPATDHALTLSMAKELCMLQRTDKGKQARQYFIRVEEEYNSPEKVIARGLVLANQQIAQLTAKIEADKPMVTFAETCLTSKDSILVREVAKLAYKDGVEIGERRLYQKLREWGLVIKGGTEPTQYAVERGWMEVREYPVSAAYGTLLRRTTMVTPKGQVYIIERLKKERIN
jgi:anti-repressor protein